MNGVSNELWGGAGSIAGCGAERSTARQEIECLLIQFGNVQMRSGKVNAQGVG